MASGIANITARAPEVLARGAAFLRETSRDRLVLGVGVGHEYTTDRRGIDWERPLARMRAYLDGMDEAAEERPPAPRLLAALGDGMLRLSAERALGAHTYFVPVAHTARAREVLGPEPVLAVEQGVVLTEDAALRARGGTGMGRALPGASELREQLAATRLRRCGRRRTTARIGCWMPRSRGDPMRSSSGCGPIGRPAPTTCASR